MQPLDLITTVKAVLTKTVKNADEALTSYPCDLGGDRLAANAEPLYIYRDRFTAKTFVRIAETIPSGKLPADVADAAAIRAHNPIHFSNDDVKGWFIEAPDFNEREGK